MCTAVIYPVGQGGSGGVGEARSAIAEYADKSPLYGFLVYRRRKVLVKFVPDGTSRLLQGMRRSISFSLEFQFRGKIRKEYIAN